MRSSLESCRDESSLEVINTHGHWVYLPFFSLDFEREFL